MNVHRSGYIAARKPKVPTRLNQRLAMRIEEKEFEKELQCDQCHLQDKIEVACARHMSVCSREWWWCGALGGLMVRTRIKLWRGCVGFIIVRCQWRMRFVCGGEV